MKTISQLTLAITLTTSLAFTACSKNEAATGTSSAAADVSLAGLPSASKMTSENSALISSHAVVGTPPLITTLKEGADGDAGTYDNSVFYGSILKTIVDDQNGTSDAVAGITSGDKLTYAQSFYGSGGTAGQPGGQGACMMAQSTAEAISRLVESGNSRCYMQGITTSTAPGIAVTSGSIAQSALFDQSTADKTVKIVVSGMGSGMDVFIKIHGTDSVTSDVYRATLHFCTASTVTSAEDISVNKVTGLVTMTNSNNESGNVGTSSVTAYIKKLNGEYVWDASKSRTADTHYSGTWGKFKSSLTINNVNEIRNKMRNTSAWGDSKVYGVSEFSGSDLQTLRFAQGGFKGIFSCTGCASDHSFSGGAEWSTSLYVNANNDMKTEAEAMDLNTDSFFTGTLGAPSVDLSAYSCSITPDATVTMDFSEPGVAALRTACEGNRFQDYDMCNQSSIQTIEGYIR